MGEQNLVDIVGLKKYFYMGNMLLRGSDKVVRAVMGNMPFRGSGKVIRAVDGISINIKKGETFGLVGESGCGKTTAGRTIIRLFEPTGGKIFFDGKDITTTRMKPLRKKMQMIFQDPYASMNPRMTVSDIIGEPIDIYKLESGNIRRDRIHLLLETVGLSREHAGRYPHEFSGGQRQRIAIARALAVQPEFIVCDEPLSALDVSIQAQIVNMLEDLQETLGLAYLFIAHDLSMVRHISKRTGVMYFGRMVEIADSSELYMKPAHPYTQALLSAAPVADPAKCREKQRIVLEGDVPGMLDIYQGCRFRARCRYALKKCKDSEPELKEITNGHLCACHLI